MSGERSALERLSSTLRRVHVVLTLLLVVTGVHLGLIAVLLRACVGGDPT